MTMKFTLEAGRPHSRRSCLSGALVLTACGADDSGDGGSAAAAAASDAP